MTCCVKSLARTTACEPGNNLVMEVPLQGSSSGRGPGLQREIAQDHVSGKQLSRDRKPGRLTLEQNHTQYYHPLDLESDNPQVKRKQIHTGSARPPVPTQRRHRPFAASARSQDVISTMSRRPGYHLHVPTLLIPGNLLAFQSSLYWTALTPLFTLVTQMAWAHKYSSGNESGIV